MNHAAIAQKLNILEDAILEIQEWANVLWVRFAGGCRFVSKLIGAKKMESNTPKMDELKTEVLNRFSDAAWGLILSASIGPFEERNALVRVRPANREEFAVFLERFIEIEGMDESGAEAEYMASLPEETQTDIDARQKMASAFFPQ